MPETHDGERCYECGRAYDLVWMAHDNLWLYIVGGPGNLLCPDCFHTLAEREEAPVQFIATRMPTGDPAWKGEHVRLADEALAHPLVVRVMDEFAGNMGFKLEGLPAYGLAKVAHYAAMVGTALALRIDPNALRTTPVEDREEAERLLRKLHASGIPTHVMGRGACPATPDEEPSDG